MDGSGVCTGAGSVVDGDVGGVGVEGLKGVVDGFPAVAESAWAEGGVGLGEESGPAFGESVAFIWVDDEEPLGDVGRLCEAIEGVGEDWAAVEFEFGLGSTGGQTEAASSAGGEEDEGDVLGGRLGQASIMA